uniref:Uncharacterized protein n=1 Tax=Tetranychus urticae TaxID=32264 RepID=T1K5I0_TETUR
MVSLLKRLSTVPSDSFKLLVCKICKKGDNILGYKTCGCLLCDSCDGDSRDKCISCDSEVDPKIKLTFTKNLRCKFYERNKCYSFAEYKCKCLNCPVCELCLNFVHRKRVSGSCDPEVLTSKVTTNSEPCQLCREFIAEFKMTLKPYAKICFNCSTNRSSICIPFDRNSDGDLDWNQLYKDFEQSSQMASDNIKKSEHVLEISISAREEKIKLCKDLISEIQKCLDEFTEQYDRSIVTLKQQLADLKKDADYLRPDGTTKTILDLLKNKELTLHGENGKEQITNFLNYYREKNNYNPVTEQIKTLLSSFDSAKLGLSVDSVGVSDNGVKPLAILIEKPFTLNERKKILEAVRKHEDKWVRKEIFSVNDTVIIFDANSTDMFKCKRAKVLNKGNHNSTVFLLDFGFEITVQNSSIGLISHPEVPTNGKKTCFLAQFTGSVNVNCGLKQQDGGFEISHIQNGFPKAQLLNVID